MPGRQRGVALLIVLWACALLAIVLGGFALLARTEGLQTRYLQAHVQARYAAEAGVARAIAALQDPLQKRRWVADGRPYTFRFDAATVRVRITDERGKVDLNGASPHLLAGLFHAAGLDRDRAQALAEAVADWRDADDASRPQGAEAAQYQAAGRRYGPRNGPFRSIEELQKVLGMTAPLYARIAPDITVWTGRPQPDPTHASGLVIQAMTGMDAADAHSYVAKRRAHSDPQVPLPTLPGIAATAITANGWVQSITSTAILANDTRAVVRATVRLRGPLQAGPPYTVLHWGEGVGDTAASAAGSARAASGRGTGSSRSR